MGKRMNFYHTKPLKFGGLFVTTGSIILTNIGEDGEKVKRILTHHSTFFLLQLNEKTLRLLKVTTHVTFFDPP